MKIAFFTEGNYQGKVPRDHPNMRTELAWMCTLNADHWNINQQPNQQYDLGIVIIPKKNPIYTPIFPQDYEGKQVVINADRLILAAGNDTMVTFFELGTSGNYANFGSTVIGFPRVDHSSSFDATNTPIDFRLGQKTRLELTGDITNVNLRFPNISGNFILVCSANGDHDVTNWKALKHDGSAATTGDVMWPGGTKPAFTDGSSSDSTDVVSFYWDNTEEQCYGVASLAFATP